MMMMMIFPERDAGDGDDETMMMWPAAGEDLPGAGPGQSGSHTPGEQM